MAAASQLVRQHARTHRGAATVDSAGASAASCSRCKPASSTSAARRPPATSARTRDCSRCGPRCTWALGTQGLRETAEVNFRHAHYLRTTLLALPGVEPLFEGPHFNEFAVRLPEARRVHREAMAAGYLAGLPLGDW